MMKEYDATEVAYRNGYKNGYKYGKRDAVVYGEWIVEKDGNTCNVKCSTCGKDYACHYGMLQLQNFDHCPKCGSKNL
jgi:DNA-directed RNA polymerase subunit RPC12/RpoP